MAQTFYDWEVIHPRISKQAALPLATRWAVVAETARQGVLQPCALHRCNGDERSGCENRGILWARPMAFSKRHFPFDRCLAISWRPGVLPPCIKLQLGRYVPLIVQYVVMKRLVLDVVLWRCAETGKLVQALDCFLGPEAKHVSGHRPSRRSASNLPEGRLSMPRTITRRTLAPQHQSSVQVVSPTGTCGMKPETCLCHDHCARKCMPSCKPRTCLNERGR